MDSHSSCVAGSNTHAVRADADEDLGSGVFALSSPEEQYQSTLAALNVGHSKNLDQLAHMFDPQAVLAGEQVMSFIDV